MRKGLAALLMTALLAGCGGVTPAPAPAPADKPAPATEVDARLTGAGVSFGFDLLKQVYDGKNTFLSPPSASVILSLTANGARGATQEGMLQGLRAGDLTLDELNRANAALQSVLANPDPKVELSLANAVWYDKEFTVAPAFVAVAKEHYRAELKEGLSVPAINKWVKDQTRGRIPEILDKTSPLTVMVLVNAIYFKGEWSSPFKANSTSDRSFTRVDGSTKSVPFMSRRAHFGYIEVDGVRGVRLPYGDGRLAMYALMPDRWDGFVESLTAERWAAWMAAAGRRELALALPKVKLEASMELKEPLIAMGMGEAFDPNRADFSGLFATLSEPVYISRVVQKSFLEINEKGTEAAAATAVEVTATSAAPSEPPLVLELNRPFLVAIRDDVTGALLFLGVIMEP